jgi:hypothetical protein
MLSVAEAIRQRRSVRAFQAREVPEATLRDIFSLAQWAPSNCNTQPWVVRVVSGAKCKQLRQRLTHAGMDPSQYQPDFPYDGRYPGIYKERQHDAAAQLYGAMGIARDDKVGRGRAALRNYAFFDAPHAAFLFLPEPFGAREAADCGCCGEVSPLSTQRKDPSGAAVRAIVRSADGTLLERGGRIGSTCSFIGRNLIGSRAKGRFEHDSLRARYPGQSARLRGRVRRPDPPGSAWPRPTSSG